MKTISDILAFLQSLNAKEAGELKVTITRVTQFQELNHLES